MRSTTLNELRLPHYNAAAAPSLGLMPSYKEQHSSTLLLPTHDPLAASSSSYKGPSPLDTAYLNPADVHTFSPRGTNRACSHSLEFFEHSPGRCTSATGVRQATSANSTFSRGLLSPPKLLTKQRQAKRHNQPQHPRQLFPPTLPLPRTFLDEPQRISGIPSFSSILGNQPPESTTICLNQSSSPSASRGIIDESKEGQILPTLSSVLSSIIASKQDPLHTLSSADACVSPSWAFPAFLDATSRWSPSFNPPTPCSLPALAPSSHLSSPLPVHSSSSPLSSPLPFVSSPPLGSVVPYVEEAPQGFSPLPTYYSNPAECSTEELNRPLQINPPSPDTKPPLGQEREDGVNIRACDPRNESNSHSGTLESQQQLGLGSGKVRRPVNSFLIFANQFRKDVQKKHAQLSNKAVSILLGNMWKRLSNEDKTPYKLMAQQVRENHKTLYPDFVYKSKRRAQSKRPLDAASEDSNKPTKKRLWSTKNCQDNPSPCFWNYLISKYCLNLNFFIIFFWSTQNSTSILRSSQDYHIHTWNR